ncbi:MAG: biotin--[acetyl-CoA-carboxylase] ligase [Candidatus Omnitrophota bacterium]
MHDEKILKILRDNTDTHTSSDELCKVTKISRAAVWKHIEDLRKEGYDIEASPHLGYKLVAIPDSLIPGEIRWKLKTKLIGNVIISYKKIDSTNDSAYALAENGIAEGTVVIAEEQTKGKGRHGRKWESPPKSGVYMSCVIRPEMAPNEIAKITLVAAVAVAKAVRLFTGLEAMIKWPNDILINGRKVCGILTEMKAEQDSIDFIIVGIGVNINTPIANLPKGGSSLKEELQRTSKSGDLSRVLFVKKMIESLEEEYSRLRVKGFKPIMEEWRSLSALPGVKIKVILQNRTIEGEAHDIDSDGSLMVRLDSGLLEKISSGDVVMLR